MVLYQGGYPIPLTKNEKYLGVLAVSFWLVLLTFSSLSLYTNLSLKANSNPTLQFGSWQDYGSAPYGQAVYYIDVEDNSSGTFKRADQIFSHEDSVTVNASCSVKLLIAPVLNKTLLGWAASPYPDMWNWFRVNVSVAHSNGTVIFSETNCSRVDMQTQPLGNNLYYGEVETILNFVTEYGTVYTVTIGFDTYW